MTAKTERETPPPYFREADALLRELGIDRPQDIRLEAIAQYCGATILYEPLGGSDARILGFRDRAIITVNTASIVSRQRFSAAHELGHWMWDRGRMAFSCGESQLSGDKSQEDAERRANRYAVDLLLPREMFVAALRGKSFTFSLIESLANEFQTSLTATAIRAVEMVRLPAMLILSDARGRRWYTRSPLVPRGLKPRPTLHPRSAALSLLKNEIAPVGLLEVDADRWIDHPEASRYSLREDSVRLGQGQVLTLLWWDEEGQLRAPDLIQIAPETETHYC